MIPTIYCRMFDIQLGTVVTTRALMLPPGSDEGFWCRYVAARNQDWNYSNSKYRPYYWIER